MMQKPCRIAGYRKNRSCNLALMPIFSMLMFVTSQSFAMSLPQNEACESAVSASVDYKITPSAPVEPDITLIPAKPTPPTAPPYGEVVLGQAGNPLADAILDVARTEVKDYLFQQILTRLCDSQNRPYFTETCNKFDQMNSSSAVGRNMESRLRVPFRQDLKILPACLIQNRFHSSLGYLTYNAYSEIVDETNLQPLGNILYGLVSDRHFAEDCAHDRPMKEANGNIRITPACSIFGTITAIRAYQEAQEDLSKVIGVFKYDVKIAFGRAASIDCFNGGKMELAICNAIASSPDVDPNYFPKLASNFDELKKSVTILDADTKKLKASASDDNKENFATALGQVGINLSALIADGQCAFNTGCGSGIDYLGQINAAVMQVYADVIQHNYVDAIGSAAPLLVCISAQDKCGDGKVPDDFAFTVKHLEEIAVLAESKDSKDFVTKLETIDQQLGNWQTQLTQRAIWVGSDLGAYVGHEQIVNGQTSSGGQSYGIIVPVGAGLSFPNPIGLGGFGGVNLNLIDAGALASTTNAKGVQSGAHSGVSQALAPGLSIYHSLMGPFVAGVSWTYKTPNLRNISNGNGTTAAADSKNRIAVFVGIDVPFVNLPW